MSPILPCPAARLVHERADLSAAAFFEAASAAVSLPHATASERVDAFLARSGLLAQAAADLPWADEYRAIAALHCRAAEHLARACRLGAR